MDGDYVLVRLRDWVGELADPELGRGLRMLAAAAPGMLPETTHLDVLGNLDAAHCRDWLASADVGRSGRAWFYCWRRTGLPRAGEAPRRQH